MGIATAPPYECATVASTVVDGEGDNGSLSKKPGNNRGRAARIAPAQAKPAPAEARLSPDAGLVKVAVTFVVIFAVMQALVLVLATRGFFEPILNATASFTGACSNATGVPAAVAGNEIALSSRILRIDLDCTGISLMLIYAALVLAYPLSIKRKLIGLGIGIPAIAVFNQLRLLAVAQLSGVLADDVFYFVHDYLFKVLMVAVVIVLWALYLASARRHAAQ